MDRISSALQLIKLRFWEGFQLSQETIRAKIQHIVGTFIYWRAFGWLLIWSYHKKWCCDHSGSGLFCTQVTFLFCTYIGVKLLGHGMCRCWTVAHMISSFLLMFSSFELIDVANSISQRWPQQYLPSYTLFFYCNLDSSSSRWSSLGPFSLNLSGLLWLPRWGLFKRTLCNDGNVLCIF